MTSTPATEFWSQQLAASLGERYGRTVSQVMADGLASAQGRRTGRELDAVHSLMLGTVLMPAVAPAALPDALGALASLWVAGQLGRQGTV